MGEEAEAEGGGSSVVHGIPARFVAMKINPSFHPLIIVSSSSDLCRLRLGRPPAAACPMSMRGQPTEQVAGICVY